MFMKALHCFYYSFISSKLVLKYMKNKIRRPQIFSLIVYKISFFDGKQRTKQNSSNLHCPVIKVNPTYFNFVNIVSVCPSVLLHLLQTNI